MDGAHVHDDYEARLSAIENGANDVVAALQNLDERVTALENEEPGPGPGPGPLPPPTERLVLEDFSDTVLHDQRWADSQPRGTPVSYVHQKSDSGWNDLLLAPGQGIDGSNAMEVRCRDSSHGLPSFWLMRKLAQSGRISGEEKFFDYNGDWNAIELTIRYPQGFRQSGSDRQPPKYPNHRNYVCGTYHALLNSGDRVEDNNWHYYYQLWFRHDLAQDDWVKIILGVPRLGWGPQAQRGNNITTPPTNFFGSLTRFYWDSLQYFSDPEISYPFSAYVDSMALLKWNEPIWDDVAGSDHKTLRSDPRIERRWHEQLLS